MVVGRFIDSDPARLLAPLAHILVGELWQPHRESKWANGGPGPYLKKIITVYYEYITNGMAFHFQKILCRKEVGMFPPQK